MTRFADSLIKAAQRGGTTHPVEGFLARGYTIHCIPDDLWRPVEFAELREIDLTGNRLRYLPSSIWCLGKLTYLNVSHNHLKKLPSQLFDCRELADLDVPPPPPPQTSNSL